MKIMKIMLFKPNAKSLLAKINLKNKKLPMYIVYNGEIYESEYGEEDSEFIYDYTPMYTHLEGNVKIVDKKHVKPNPFHKK